MYAIVNNDLVTGLASGDTVGFPLPLEHQDLPIERLRFDGTGIVDAADYSTFYVDDAGNKHIQDASGRSEVHCDWDSILVMEDDAWRVETASDVLIDEKNKASTLIDTQAEKARQQFITPGDGQVGVYMKKEAEAAAWQAEVDATNTPDPADYPYLKARAERINAGAPDYQAVADEWNAKAAAWATVGIAIEDIREQAKEDVQAAADQAAVDAILAALSWPSPSA